MTETTVGSDVFEGVRATADLGKATSKIRALGPGWRT